MISNDPYFKRRITPSHVITKNYFDIQEINNISKMVSVEELEKAQTVSSGRFGRISKVKFFHKNEKNNWFFNRMNKLIYSINNINYNLNLYGYDVFQYTVYNCEDQGKYDWHTDIILNNNLGGMEADSTRKLSLVMLLSQPYEEFTGGEFQLNLGMEENAITPTLNKGDIIAFPSFMIHRVKPVLTGIRKSIVIWVEGPKFR